MRILITGAAGFIGANLFRSWDGAGHEVHGLFRPDGDPWRLEGVGGTRHQLDLTDSRQMIELVMNVRPDVIIHAAAHGAYSWQHDLEQMNDINIVATAALVDAAVEIGVERFVHLGSSSEYGYSDHAPAETERIKPNSPYAVTKAAGSHLVAEAIRSGRLRGAVLRLYAVYGPWEDPRRLMPTLAWWARQGRLPPRLVSPTTARDFVHVDDVLSAVEQCLSGPLPVLDPPVFNIGSGSQTTLGELVETVRATFRIGEEPQWGTMPDRSWDTPNWVSDPSRALEVLGWSATVTLAEGIGSLTEFVAVHEERYAPST